MGNQRQSGAVSWFNSAKGFGFIKRMDGEADIFVHYSGITGEGYKLLHEGDQVTFLVGQGVKGLQAEDVRIT